MLNSSGSTQGHIRRQKRRRGGGTSRYAHSRGQARRQGGAGANFRVVGNERALDKIFAQARRTGNCVLINRQLEEFPDKLCFLLDEKNITKDEKWWECVDITSLDLSQNRIISIPRAIVNFTHLTTLVMHHNALARIPNELCSLIELKRIDFSHNLLTQLPPDFHLLLNLVDLSLAHNRLSQLPTCICELEQLTVLNVESNALSTLPEEIGDLKCLTKLNVSSNSIERLPRSISQLKRLESLEAKQNRLSSCPSLAQLSRLSYLDLNDNGLGQLPTLPSKPSSALSVVHAGFNRIQVLDGIESARQLVTLDVRDNMLQSIPVELALNCNLLKHLDIQNNDIKDLPGELGLVKSLTVLTIQGNPLKRIPRSKLNLGIHGLKKYLTSRIAPDAHLQTTNPHATISSSNQYSSYTHEHKEQILHNGGVNNNNNDNDNADDEFVETAIRIGTSQKTVDLSSEGYLLEYIPERLYSLPDLEKLDLSHNHLDESKFSISKMKTSYLPVSLLSLRITNNIMTQIPPSIYSLSSLTELDLSHNRIKRLSNSNIQEMKSLRVLNLQHNRLDSFPEAVLLVTTLKELLLGYNNINQLPAIHSYLPELSRLDLSNNAVSTLADGLRYCRNLTSLNLENNNIAKLPLELALCPLQALLLYGNPQRTVGSSMLTRGTAQIIDYLRKKIPLDSPLLTENLDEHKQQQQQQHVSSSSFTNSRALNNSSSSYPTTTTNQRDAYLNNLESNFNTDPYHHHNNNNTNNNNNNHLHRVGDGGNRQGASCNADDNNNNNNNHKNNDNYPNLNHTNRMTNHQNRNHHYHRSAAPFATSDDINSTSSPHIQRSRMQPRVYRPW